MKPDLYCHICDNDNKRTLGLQGVYHLPWNHGAWFMFNEPTTSGFWMKNTPIPLELLFLNNHYGVISIHNLKPHDAHIVSCDIPYKYALEVNPGWCESYGIKAGNNLQDHVNLIFISNNL